MLVDETARKSHVLRALRALHRVKANSKYLDLYWSTKKVTGRYETAYMSSFDRACSHIIIEK